MARLLGCLKRSIVSSLVSRNPILQRDSLYLILEKRGPSPLMSSRVLTTRDYISEMRKSAFEGNILRLIRNEIKYELDHSHPGQPVTRYGEYAVNDQPGELWINMRRIFGSEDIKIEASMFDGSVPASKSGGGAGEEVQLHITIVVKVSKGDSDEAFEIMCSAWPDSLEITKLFVHNNNKMSSATYTGPEFRELDDELQDSLYEFLEERGITDDLAVFLHQYMKNKDKMEYIGWLETVKSYVERT